MSDLIAKASILQHRAADPDMNIWVGASAGTGKTKVLTDRVLRLLLSKTGKHDGTPPQNILCITFTKAGASEMIARVMKRLSFWAVCPAKELNDQLEALLGKPPSIHQGDKARRLFAEVIDTPGGLNITTIHAFCQSILGRFTLEAGISPHSELMTDQEAASAIDRILNRFIAEYSVEQDYQDFFAKKNHSQIQKIIRSIITERKKLKTITPEKPEGSEDDLFNSYFIRDFRAEPMRRLAKAFDIGSEKSKKNAQKIYDFCAGDSNEKFRNLSHYLSVFLTQNNDIKSTRNYITKAMQDAEPSAVDLFLTEADRVKSYHNDVMDLRVAIATYCLLSIAQKILQDYEEYKTQIHKLDYNDLIYKTMGLLKSDARDWVLHKLDYAIDHILVDEAQDTSPEQWDIILAILEEFLSGETHRNLKINRTVFVVGDLKQSIFSFQGADPKIFQTVLTKIQTDMRGAGKKFEIIPMNTSFRSTAAVLEIVDSIFEAADMRVALVQNSEDYKPHLSARSGHAGRIDIWPLFKAPKKESRDPWTLPIAIKNSYDAQAKLAAQIASHIATLIRNEAILKSRNRPIQAGDFMILVRRRNALVDHMIRALKAENIPVSGADRLVVSNHIAVQDCLAVMDFALLPSDDLTLATLLKSPFIGWDDDRLLQYATDRTGSLWDAIQNSDCIKECEWLLRLVHDVPHAYPFEALSDLLTLPTPDHINGWKAMVQRLGDDCLDPLDELLTMAQQFQTDHPGADLHNFLHAMRHNTSEIKRELEGAGGMVRIMTVHASKGLQAPIVILPDTTSLPQSAGKSDDGFVWDENGNPLWTFSADHQNEAIKNAKAYQAQKQLAEYQRLLYVALTRAEDRLIICGALNQNQKDVPEKCWYESIRIGMETLTETQKKDGDFDQNYCNTPEILIYETAQNADTKQAVSKDKKSENINYPDWMFQPIPQEKNPLHILKPSQGDDAETPVRSPLTQGDESYRFRRGNLTHALLQYLPDYAADNWARLAQHYLNRKAPDLTDDLKNDIAKEVLAILNHPDFEPFFGQGSLAEVPVTGVVQNNNGRTDIIAGQIDRLLITDDTVWIIDFKSNRPPPKDPQHIPQHYRNQLAAYKTLMQQIYPEHAIRCALLWTDGPRMIEML